MNSTTSKHNLRNKKRTGVIYNAEIKFHAICSRLAKNLNFSFVVFLYAFTLWDMSNRKKISDDE